MPAPDDQEDRSLPALGERYELGDLLGAGGAAVVYRALDRWSGRQVAVKVFDPQVSRAGRPGHGFEAATLGGLRHPGLVELYDAGSEQGQAYLVMQLIDGGTLADRIERGPSPVATVADIGARLAETLAYVHERGVVHRDMKPGNVLLDAGQRPYLADFGASRLIDATRVTATGFVVGTPAFMAPEQVRGQAVGPAADVYALGLILLEALTGRREYPGDVVESAVARLHRRPAVPAHLPAALRSLLTAMTEDDPGRRPAAGTVALSLAAMRTENTLAPTAPLPPSVVSSRNRWTVLRAAAATVVVAAGALVLTTTGDPAPTPRAAADPPVSVPATPTVEARPVVAVAPPSPTAPSPAAPSPAAPSPAAPSPAAPEPAGAAAPPPPPASAVAAAATHHRLAAEPVVADPAPEEPGADPHRSRAARTAPVSAGRSAADHADRGGDHRAKTEDRAEDKAEDRTEHKAEDKAGGSGRSGEGKRAR